VPSLEPTFDDIEAPLQVTTDFTNHRFIIGDRNIEEKDLGTIQKDRVKEMQKWARIVKKLKEETAKRVILIFLILTVKESFEFYKMNFSPNLA
jgi:hypothetical protein